MAQIINSKFFEENSFYNELLESNRIVNTYINADRVSENSFSFNIGTLPTRDNTYMGKLCEKLKAIFNINNPLFDEKIESALYGAGQEWRRFNVIHSSSLAAFLFFYSVSDDNPVEAIINGSKCIFTKSEFEVDNLVSKDKKGRGNNSHIDVKLSGKLGSKGVSLYLESKFAEYILYRGDCKGISSIEEYDNIYSKIENNIKGIEVVRESDRYNIIQISKKPYARYCNGIKQFISHYVGMTNCKDESDLVFLGEVVFDFGLSSKGFNFLKDYSLLHSETVGFLSQLNKNNQKFQLVNSLLTYQDSFSKDHLDPNVRRFYNL